MNFPSKASERQKKDFGIYVRRVQQPNEAQPRAINLWTLPVHKPVAMQSARPAGNDHLRIRSFGVLT